MTQPTRKKTKVLNRCQILKSVDLGLTEADVPEWGGSVFIRGLTGAERASWEEYLTNATHKGKIAPNSNLRESVLVRAICDQDGNPIFGIDDMVALSKKNGNVTGRLFDIAAKLSGLDEKDVENAIKN